MPDPLAAVCTASVSALQGTGSALPPWLALAALGLLVLGVALLLVLRRSAVAGMIAAALIAALVIAPAAPAAHAAEVDYGTGCALFQVDDVAFSADTGELLPGDSVIALTAKVANRYAGPIELDGIASLSDASLVGALVVTVDFDGASGLVTVPAGDSVLVTVTVSMPADAVDSLQGLSTALTLELTATAA